MPFRAIPVCSLLVSCHLIRFGSNPVILLALLLSWKIFNQLPMFLCNCLSVERLASLFNEC